MHSDTWSLDPTLPALSALPAAGARLTPELLSVAAGARRRAARDGDRQIDTAHLLHSLLETDPRARALCDGGTGRSVRVLGYLAQRSIGYGLRWRHAVEDGPPSRGDDPVAGWSPCAAAAMGAAVRRASARGAYRADGEDLLAALAGEPDCRAAKVLSSAGVDPVRLVAGMTSEGASDRASGGEGVRRYPGEGPVVS